MFENYTILQLAIMASMVLGAFVIRGMSGFGAGMIGIPLLAFLIPVHTAVSMFGLLVLVLFTFLSIRDWREVVRHELKLLLAPTLLGVVAGVLLFKHLDSSLLLQLLGGFLITYALYTFAANYFKLPEMTCSDRWAIPVGFVGAVIDTLFGGGGGTLVVIYLHLRRVDGRRSAPRSRCSGCSRWSRASQATARRGTTRWTRCCCARCCCRLCSREPGSASAWATASARKPFPGSWRGCSR